MKKENLAPQLLSALEGEALEVFLSTVNEALGKNYSAARAYAAGFVALQRAGYKKGPSGKWVKEVLCVKMHKLQKQDDDKRLVFGFFSVVEQEGIPVIDSQGDVITTEDLEEAVYRYVKFSRMGDERHDERCKAVLVESMVLTKEKQQALGVDLGFVGWWGGFEIIDDALWAKFKSREYESFSIGGRGRYEQFDL